MADASTVRRILHCDMDSFYASVHVRDDPSLAGQPVIIGGSPKGRGVVAAASYEVRKYGVHSAMPAARAVRLCPHAVFIKPDFSRYRAESEKIFDIFRRFTDVIQPVSIDEAYLDVSDHLEPWGSGTGVAEEIKRQVKQERGLTVSVGVGPNRLIAKIASDFDKPDGLTVVKPGHVHAFLDPMSVRRLPGVGPATERRIKRTGIETIGELRAQPLDRLEKLFGRHGGTLYRYARGLDERPVRMRHTRKSLSTERTYAEDLVELDQMEAEIDRLSERVASSLQKKELSACTLTVKIRYGDFTTLTRSRTLDGPTNEQKVIAGHARELLRLSEAGKRSVRLLGVGTSNLVRGNIAQLELFA
jgi:DNA polymerase-4